MANVMRRPHFRLPIVLIRLNCDSPGTEVCHRATIEMHNDLLDISSGHRDYQFMSFLWGRLSNLSHCVL